MSSVAGVIVPETMRDLPVTIGKDGQDRIQLFS